MPTPRARSRRASPASPRARASAQPAASDTLITALAAEGASAQSQRQFRAAALARIAGAVRYDAAFFHALSPRVPLETGVTVGIELSTIAATLAHWDRLAVELEPLRTFALAHGGVVADHEALTPGSRARASFERAIVKPLGMRSLAIVHLCLRERITGAILLLRKRADPFSPAELAQLRAIVPVLSIADAAHEPAHDAPASLPVKLRCVDQRLTDRQREVVEHVALGYTNAEIARALGLSSNTLRNHLVGVFERLGAANRADVVRLAVLR